MQKNVKNLIKSFLICARFPVKKIFDIVFGLFALACFFPIIVLIAILIRWRVGSPIFFKQARPGLNGNIFNMYKFRTMTNECDKDGNLLIDEVRLTKFGKFLRSTSLDELPGLWNVLKGDMSLVGPRPLLVEYLPLYSKRQSRRHEVRPGITGWAQVNGRNAISWDEKFDLDVWYLDNQSFWLDIKILWLTVKKVLVRDSITAEGEVTMSAFKGSKNE
jgi:lipopolysaccharide/colanic/teichoic acid biosynthesis glycosyltransferase